MNKVILSGNLARDPEIRYTQSQKAVASFSLAVNRRFGRRAQEENPQQPTADFINIVAWERHAEFVQKYLTKGSRIIVEGRLQSRSYEAQDGSRRYVTEVVANEIEFAGSRPQNGGYQPQADGYSAPAPAAAPSMPQSAPPMGSSVTDEDIPF
jgi:single-strand DNA-binding protein